MSDDESNAQNRVPINSENATTEIMCSKDVRLVSISFVEVVTKRVVDIKCYRVRNFTLENKLENEGYP